MTSTNLHEFMDFLRGFAPYVYRKLPSELPSTCVVFAGHFYSPGSGGSGLGAQLFAFLARCHRAILSIRDGNGTGETMQRRSSYKERRSKAFISGVVGCGRHATVCIVFQTSKLDFCYVFLCENISFCDFFKDLFAENKSP